MHCPEGAGQDVNDGVWWWVVCPAPSGQRLRFVALAPGRRWALPQAKLCKPDGL